jgi:hypothetical protein
MQPLDAEARKALMRGGSKTFFAASLLLPARVRDPATALYAYCRLADDAVDTAELADAAVETAILADDAVTNAKLANMTRGTVKVGGAADAPTDLAAKTSGYILVGDGTDLVSVAVSGDVTLAAGGAVTIAADAVETAMIADGAVTVAKLGSGNLHQQVILLNCITRTVPNTGGFVYPERYSTIAYVDVDSLPDGAVVKLWGYATAASTFIVYLGNAELAKTRLSRLSSNETNLFQSQSTGKKDARHARV